MNKKTSVIGGHHGITVNHGKSRNNNIVKILITP